MSARNDTCEWAISDDEKTADPECGYKAESGKKFYMVGGKFLFPCPGCGLEIKVTRSFKPALPIREDRIAK